MSKSKGSLIGYKALGNFKLQSENETTACLSHDPLEIEGMPLPWQYGGDIAANIVLAASARLPPSCELRPMSCNIEYVNPGDITKVREYHVERLRQSERFVHMLVRIKQSDKCVAVGNVTFHCNEGTPQSLNYRQTFPEDCPMPNDLLDDHVALGQLEKEFGLSATEVSEHKRTIYMAYGLGLNVRPVNPRDYFRLNTEPVVRLAFWMRYRESEVTKFFSDLESTTWSAGLIAYASDYRIMSSALRQNPNFTPGKMTTLSHAIWFAPDASCEMKAPTDWLLYTTSIRFSGNNTVLCDGTLWNENKQLLAATTQQGLIRPKE